jgi:hypothetical protein
MSGCHRFGSSGLFFVLFAGRGQTLFLPAIVGVNFAYISFCRT